MTVSEYIKNNWKSTVCTGFHKKNHTLSDIDLSFTVPCINDLFVNFFYWDTYFTNIGLLSDGFTQQAKSNIAVMCSLIDKFGFIPNADHITTRTQPPLFTRAVYDYYKAVNDMDFLKECIPYMIREQNFFEENRMTELGLNAYGNCEPKKGKDWYYDEFDRRIKYTEKEKELEKYGFCSDLLAIAESGWDFNSRFKTENNRFASGSFIHLDLNCILYDAEIKLSELLEITLDSETSKIYFNKAQKRKDLINKYFYCKEKNLYLDYNYKDNKFSSVVSAASLYPYALGISDDKISAKGVYEKLNLKCGISASEYLGDNIQTFQWDYPNLWPTNVYFAYLAMANTGLDSEALEVRDKYISVIESTFDKTGKLWEKYDALTGDVSVTVEYDTPAMMGWTAGVYKFLLNK